MGGVAVRAVAGAWAGYQAGHLVLVSDSAGANLVTAASLRDCDFFGLPPTVLISGQCDPLADDSRDYAAAIHKAGGQVLHVEVAGLVHGYLRARASVVRARASFESILSAIDTFGRAKPFPPTL